MGQVFKSLSTIKPYLRYMSLEKRRQIVYSKVLGTAVYGIGPHTGQRANAKDKMTPIFIRATREIYGLPVPLKTKNEYICKKIGMKTPRQLITKAGLQFIHRVINTQMPMDIFDVLVFRRKMRRNAKINTITKHQTIKYVEKHYLQDFT